MIPTDLATLLAAVAHDRAAAATHAERALTHRDDLESDLHQTVVAASLHHWYSAIESLAERVLRAFGQTVGSGDRWHQELLAAAGYDLPDVRPRLFAADTLAELRGLLSFRHFFRRAYAVAWDPERLAANVASLERAVSLVARDLDAFEAAARAGGG